MKKRPCVSAAQPVPQVQGDVRAAAVQAPIAGIGVRHQAPGQLLREAHRFKPAIANRIFGVRPCDADSVRESNIFNHPCFGMAE